jgi:hypothetical protein
VTTYQGKNISCGNMLEFFNQFQQSKKLEMVVLNGFPTLGLRMIMTQVPVEVTPLHLIYDLWI